jgi:SSS family solute:Na+ symporter
MSGINLYLMALVFYVILGWDLHLSIWISAAVIGIYIAFGGLLSAIFTEILQFFLIWFGLFLVSVLGIIELGGLDNILSTLPERMSGLWSTAVNPAANEMGVTWVGIVLGLGFVLSFGYWTTDFLLVQRAFSAKDLDSARKTPIYASFFKMALPFIVVIGGLVAWKLQDLGQLQLLAHPVSGEAWNDTALPVLIARYFPAGLVGLGITALLAGFMAGQAGNVSAFNTVFTYDIYRALFKKDASDAHLILVGRIVTVAGVFLSILTAYAAMQFNTIMDYIQAIFSWVNAPLFATMLLGMFWARCTSAAAFWGLVLGMVSSFTMFIGINFKWINPAILTFSENPSDMSNNLWRAWWAWLICFIATIIISYLTTPKPKEELVGLVKGLTEEKIHIEQPWYKMPEFIAIIALIVAVALNVYFW